MMMEGLLAAQKGPITQQADPRPRAQVWKGGFAAAAAAAMCSRRVQQQHISCLAAQRNGRLRSAATVVSAQRLLGRPQRSAASASA
jgi:hypothetical protein